MNPTASAQPRRAAAAAFIGTMIEWYDFYIYATAAALVFGALFFPSDDSLFSTMAAFGTFAVGFFARPLGGIVFGHVGDRIGRKKSLVITLLMMGIVTVCIGLLPTYAQIGATAPVLLILLRIVQGIAVGGEWGGAVLMAGEHAPKGRRNFFASFAQLGSPAGLILSLLAFGAVTRLPEEELMSWGWRVPFVIGALCAVVALYLRRGMEETASFTKKEKAKESLMRTLLRHPKELMTVVGLTMGGTLAFYTYTTYMQKYLVNTVGMSISDSTTISAATLFLFMCLQPVIGGLSDKIGRRPILIAFGVLGTLFTVPILSTLHTIQTWWGAFFLIMAALIIVSGYTSINAVVKAELFPTEIRALGVGLP
ncbi:alpha-ketoglutarate permease, partial [Arthrobacter stackebrandtii]